MTESMPPEPTTPAPAPTTPAPTTPAPPPMTSAPPMTPAPVAAATVRPMGATVISIVNGLLGGFYAVIGLFALLGSAILGGASGAVDAQSGVPGFGAMFAGLGIVITIIFALFALLYFAIAYGTWKGRSWAWMLGLVASIIFLVLGVLGLAGDVNLFSILLIAVPIVTIYFLFQADVKRWLGRPA